MQSHSSSPRLPRRRVITTLGLVAGAAVGVIGGRPARAAAEPASDTPYYDTATSVTALRTGVDYSWSRPRPSAIAAAGYTFACRYVSWDTSGKNLTASEASALIAAGIDVVTNWEYSANEALNGYSAGVSNAREAQRQALACGMPAGRPIYFSVDFDASASQQPAINAYFDGVASVIGVARTGAYAGYYPIQRLFDAGKIGWGWQTYAWSGGRWDSRAHLRQVQNGLTLDGASIDRNEAMTVDFGQWGTGRGVSGTVYHRLRRPDGSWTVFGSLALSGVNVVTSAGDRSGVVHVAVVRDGQVQHRVRYTDGTWSVWGGLGNPGTATALAAATDSTGLLHLAAVLNGQVHHRVRYTDGTWSVWGGLGNPGTATALAAATDSTGLLHLAAVVNGQVQHRVRYTDGTWSVWGGLGNPGTASALAAATDSTGLLHLAAVFNGQVHHRVRYTDSMWSVWGGLSNPGTANALAAATDSTGLLHLATVVNGQIQHRVRYTDTTWSVWGGLGNPGTAVSIGAATDPTGNFHLTTAA